MQHEIWVTHETVYEFDRSIDGATVRARLRPIDDPSQTTLESEVLCHPRPVHRSRTVDSQGCALDRLVLQGPLRRIEVRGQSRMRWKPDADGPRLDFAPSEADSEPAPAWSRPGGGIWNWAKRTLPDRTPAEPDVSAFMEMLRDEFSFDPHATDARTSTPAFFRARRGVCQDYAMLAAGCLRARGIPVRIVLGYLIREPGGGHRFEEGQPHAWLSAWHPGAGWVDSDPTTGLRPPAHHVTLRRGRRLRDVQPVAGRLRAAPHAGQRLTVRVTIVKDTLPS